MLIMGRSYERAGKPELPVWWATLFLEKIEADERSYTAIAKEASEIAGRENPWGGTAISKLKDGSAVTRELANALSDVLGIPRPFFEARSAAEAVALANIARAFDGVPTRSPVNPDKVSRRSRVFGALDNVVADAERRTTPVVSEDERSPRSLGSRRASAGRQKASRSRS